MDTIYTLPPLPYAYDALEPSIDARTMEIHHDKHHRGYVEKLNKAIEDCPQLAKKTLAELLGDLDAVPMSVREQIRNQGGGHYNHSFFWKIMRKNGGGVPRGIIGDAINKEFGTFELFKEKFNNAAKTVFGSGWAWLCADTAGMLTIVSTHNQDCPLSQGLNPVLGLDVWEHAYYLKYQNKRPDYISAWWDVINWDQVEENLDFVKLSL